MATTFNNRVKVGNNSNKTEVPFTSYAMQQTLDESHELKLGQDLSQQLKEVKQNYDTLKQLQCEKSVNKMLRNEINQWESESIARIKSTAKKARADLKRVTIQSKRRLTGSEIRLSNELHLNRKAKRQSESGIENCRQLFEDYKQEVEKLSAIKIDKFSLPSSPLIQIENPYSTMKKTTNQLPQNIVGSEEKSREIDEDAMSSQDNYSTESKSEASTQMLTTSSSQPYQYPSVSFGANPSSHQEIHRLFEHLKSLPPMDKNGPMNGNCDIETRQMEKFLSRKFGFKNIDGEYIVQGVRSFRLDRPPESMEKDEVIHFPHRTTNLFVMTVQEIIDWQQSYAVYADKNVEGMTKDFLQRALRGLSKDGKEAFRMKFVIRISKCPILMEFDARIIPRIPGDEWSHKIKLVSVTGVDFAGRKHDVEDIITYVSNWKDVYEIDPRSGLPLVSNGRDFQPKVNGPQGRLDQKRLLNDLIRMARLRLRTCDKEGVQIVVETGIGLGVFAGKRIGIDQQVRALSARAIRTVLEQDGPSYKTIRGVVFALPIFDEVQSNSRIQDTYQAFAHEFETKKYNGPIPVLIADQDMHRLTVAVARQGFIVSELNPADSHGVFGEYWQNRGPAVEEKLALTTVGLLVQHHLINPHVLNPNNYHLIQLET